MSRVVLPPLVGFNGGYAAGALFELQVSAAYVTCDHVWYRFLKTPPTAGHAHPRR